MGVATATAQHSGIAESLGCLILRWPGAKAAATL
jgi:hypothetical protein